MGDAGPMDPASESTLYAIVAIVLLYILTGLILGIILGVRACTQAAGKRSRWRRTNAIAWTWTAIGWGANILSFGLNYAMLRHGGHYHPWTSAVSFVVAILWLSTILCPLLWIIAWFQARRPDAEPAELEIRPPADSGAWPPAPNSRRKE